MNRVKRAHIYILLAMFASLIFQLVLGSILESSASEMSFITSALLSQYGLVLVPIIIYFIVTKASIKDTLHFKKISAPNFFLAVGLGFFIQPFMSLINLISQLFVTNYMVDYVDEMMAMPFWLLLFVIAVTPAITEEITFRGIVLSNYQNQKVITTCIMNGLLFGMFHGNLNQFAYAFFLGAIFCYVAHLTGSIIPSMIMHFIVNGTQVSLQKIVVVLEDLLYSNPDVMNEVISSTPTQGEILASILVILGLVIFIGLPLSFLMLYLMHRHNHQPNFFKNKSISGVVMGTVEPIIDENGEIITATKERLVTPVLILLIGYFVIYTALFEFILPAMS